MLVELGRPVNFGTTIDEIMSLFFQFSHHQHGCCQVFALSAAVRLVCGHPFGQEIGTTRLSRRSRQDRTERAPSSLLDSLLDDQALEATEWMVKRVLKLDIQHALCGNVGEFFRNLSAATI